MYKAESLISIMVEISNIVTDSHYDLNAGVYFPGSVQSHGGGASKA